MRTALRQLLIAGPNLTLDRTLSVDEFVPGATVEPSGVAVTPGGKGVNVARAARELGSPATLVGLVPGHMGRAVAALLAEEDIELSEVLVQGELRVALIVLERSGRATVLNEPGPTLAPHEWAAYETAVGERFGDHQVVVCSGSLPPGAPDDAYARIVRAARAQRRTVLVDASGTALAEALSERPDIVCPNLAEAEGVVTGATSESVEARADAARAAVDAGRELVRRGARNAVVTAAAAGAALVRTDGPAFWIAAPRVSARNPMGAGDVFAAVLASAIARRVDLLDACRRAVGFAAASVEHPRAGCFDETRAQDLAASVDAARV